MGREHRRVTAMKVIIDMDKSSIYIRELGRDVLVKSWIEEQVNGSILRHKIWIITAINSGMIAGLIGLMLIMLK